MSFLELEQNIRDALDAYNAERQRKAKKKGEKKERSAFKKAKSERAPMYRPDAPFKMRVVLNLRRKYADGSLGELIEQHYDIATFGETAAEHEARAQARADGFAWRGTVSVEPLIR